MSGFRSALGVGDSLDEALAATVAALQPVDPDWSLGFVYATEAVAGSLERAVEVLRRETGITTWIGTVGAGVLGTGEEAYDRPAFSVLATSLAPAACRVLPLLDSEEAALAAAPEASDSGVGVALVHGDPRQPRLPALVSALSHGGEAFVVGGLTGGQEQFPQVADGVVDGGLSGVAFSPQVPIRVGISQGCSPIGPVRRVTAVERNVIAEIDGRPALEAFAADVGEVLMRRPERIAGYIFAGFPIAGTDTGDYLVRNLMAIDGQSGSVSVASLPAEGDPILFCRRDRGSAVEDLDRMLAGIARGLEGPPKAGVYVSCLARGRHLFGENSEEARQIRDRLGDFPLAGFFANGELYRDHIYGYTGVLLLFA